MDFDRAEQRMLVALWIDHHGRHRLIGPDVLRSEYGVDLPRPWHESFAATFTSRGWVDVYADMASSAMSLRAEGYRHGLAAALTLTGGTDLTVNFPQKELLGDGRFPSDMLGGPGWKYLEYEKDGQPSEPPRKDVYREVVLDHADPEYQVISDGIAKALRDVEGDNQLSDREDAAVRLRYAQSVWSQVSVKLIVLRVGVLMTVDEMCDLAVNAYYHTALAALAQGIRSFARSKLHTDLDGLL